MPSERVTMLFDELGSMGFRGYITFHHLSEAFIDKRLMKIARDARSRGMKPYIHTNGDVLRNDEALCREAAEVFEYIVVGLYDYETEEEKQGEKEFWKKRLTGTKVMFSLAERVYVRTHSPRNDRMSAIDSRTYPDAVCAEPQKYLLIHYNGDIAPCCEDMHGEQQAATMASESSVHPSPITSASKSVNVCELTDANAQRSAALQLSVDTMTLTFG